MTRTRNRSILYISSDLLFLWRIQICYRRIGKTRHYSWNINGRESSSMLMQHFVRMAHGNFFIHPVYAYLEMWETPIWNIFWWKCFEIWKTAAMHQMEILNAFKGINHLLLQKGNLHFGLERWWKNFKSSRLFPASDAKVGDAADDASIISD
jgi:hypothetical protein